jgi:predicted amidohydrolase YtcJ
MFIASTRRSALNPALPAQQPHFALPIVEAVVHATADSAWACRAENALGRLRPGMLADFVVLDGDPFITGPDSLLEMSVVCTAVSGRAVWQAL